MSFIVGQRWISDTEGDLGLGRVTAQDARTVTLFFPAINENRVYARQDAPITRVIFKQDDVITSQEGWQLKITQIEHNRGIIFYLGTRLDNGETDCLLPEMDLDGKINYGKPQLRLFSGQIDRSEHFAMRYRAQIHYSQQFRMPWSGLRGMRTSLIPHQLHIAYEVGHRHAPRVLLADEVGLGKTIEAGMIIHQQLLAGRAERILIIVPETLQHQWLLEMLRRFNLHFSLFDEERYSESKFDDQNPFETEQLIICSLDFVCQDQQRLQQLIDVGWDLLVVDEAHHLSWNEQEASPEYQAIESLANTIPGVLLLTATPEQLGQKSHFARLRLLDPARFYSYPDFIAEQQQYRPIADAVDLLLADSDLNQQTLNSLTELISEQDIEPLLKAANSHSEDRKTARQRLIQILMDRHGTSRILFRNTRQGVKGFPLRCLHQIKLATPPQYVSAMNLASAIIANGSLEKQLNYLLFPEKIYQTFCKGEVKWLDIDPRVSWLIDYLKQNRDEKILVICTKADTALQLEQVLREREAIRAAVFHEELSILERDRAAAFFASQECGAQVLLCSEIGSEGRNFQFASKLVMFDLPVNPDLLEQRIGRLDRIGQKHDIDIFVPYLTHTTQEILLRWYHEGLEAFEHTCPSGRTLFDQFKSTLLPFLIQPENQTGLDDLLRETHKRHNQLKAQLEAGRDRLLELNSSGGEAAQQLVNAIQQQDGEKSLVDFSLKLFDLIGLHQNDDRDGLINIIPGSDMLVPDFPGIPEEGATITFDREQALSLEDSQFITWEHPYLLHGLDLLISGNIGRCAVCLLKNKSLPLGTILLEMVYVVEAQAPKSLQLTRFLPPTPVRLLLDIKGNDLAEKVDFEKLHNQLIHTKRSTATSVAKTLQNEISNIIELSEGLIAQKAQSIIAEAQKRADEAISVELNRLESLKAVNPNIREDEISAVEQNRRQVLLCLEQANWRLDALRLIAITHQ